MVGVVDVGIFHESEAGRRSSWQQHGQQSSIDSVWEMDQVGQ